MGVQVSCFLCLSFAGVVMATSTIPSANRTPVAAAATLLPKTTTLGPPTLEPSRARGPRVGRRRAEPGVLAVAAPVFDLLSGSVLSKLGVKQRLSVTAQRFIKAASGLKAAVCPPYHH